MIHKLHLIRFASRHLPFASDYDLDSRRKKAEPRIRTLTGCRIAVNNRVQIRQRQGAIWLGINSGSYQPFSRLIACEWRKLYRGKASSVSRYGGVEFSKFVVGCDQEQNS